MVLKTVTVVCLLAAVGYGLPAGAFGKDGLAKNLHRIHIDSSPELGRGHHDETHRWKRQPILGDGVGGGGGGGGGDGGGGGGGGGGGDGANGGLIGDVGVLSNILNDAVSVDVNNLGVLGVGSEVDNTVVEDPTPGAGSGNGGSRGGAGSVAGGSTGPGGSSNTGNGNGSGSGKGGSSCGVDSSAGCASSCASSKTTMKEYLQILLGLVDTMCCETPAGGTSLNTNNDSNGGNVAETTAPASDDTSALSPANGDNLVGGDTASPDPGNGGSSDNPPTSSGTATDPSRGSSAPSDTTCVQSCQTGRGGGDTTSPRCSFSCVNGSINCCSNNISCYFFLTCIQKMISEYLTCTGQCQ